MIDKRVAWKGDADDLSLGWSQENNKKGTFTLAAKIAIANSEWVFSRQTLEAETRTSESESRIELMWTPRKDGCRDCHSLWNLVQKGSTL